MPERKSERKSKSQKESKTRRANATQSKKLILNNVSFDRYIHKICKQVTYEIGMSSKSKQILSSIMTIISKKVAKNASDLTEYGKKKTIQDKDIQTAVVLLLPGELAKHAVREGRKAVTKLISSYDEKNTKKKRYLVELV